jgi:DNA-binding transcriptional LysR family regulator
LIELKQLEYFVVAADCKSFSRAAEVLYTTQPNVSRIIRQLEQQMGAELFVRQGRGIKLSDEGRQIYQYACNILNNAKLLSSSIRPRDERRLAVASTPSNQLTGLIAEWYKAHEDDDSQCSYLEGSTEDVVKYVENFQADVGFVYVTRQQMPSFQYLLNQKKMQFEEILKSQPILAMGRHNPHYGSVPDRSVLDTIGLVSYQSDNFALDSEYADRYRVVTNSEHTLITLLQNTNLGIICAGLNLHSGNIGEIPLCDCDTCVSYGFITRKNNEMLPQTEEFIDMVLQTLRKPGAQAPCDDCVDGCSCKHDLAGQETEAEEL